MCDAEVGRKAYFVALKIFTLALFSAIYQIQLYRAPWKLKTEVLCTIDIGMEGSVVALGLRIRTGKMATVLRYRSRFSRYGTETVKSAGKSTGTHCCALEVIFSARRTTNSIISIPLNLLQVLCRVPTRRRIAMYARLTSSSVCLEYELSFLTLSGGMN